MKSNKDKHFHHLPLKVTVSDLHENVKEKAKNLVGSILVSWDFHVRPRLARNDKFLLPVFAFPEAKDVGWILIMPGRFHGQILRRSYYWPSQEASNGFAHSSQPSASIAKSNQST